MDIDAIQQRVEGWAEIETAAAVVADLIDPQRFFLQLLGIDRIDEAEAFHANAGREAVGNQLSALERNFSVLIAGG